VTMIPGDGIGPEMMSYVKEIFTVAGVPVDFEKINFDPKHLTSTEDLRQVRNWRQIFNSVTLRILLLRPQMTNFVPKLF
jgi:isocitrate/isopropylmalate dehydrogenase